MKKEFLIGFTKDYEIIMAELELRDSNFENEFLGYFSAYNIINANNTIYDKDCIYEHVRNMLEAMDLDYRYELCGRYNCDLRNLQKKLTDKYIENPQELIEWLDYSRHYGIINNKDSDYIFKAIIGGLYDTRGDLLYAVDSDLYNDIHFLWDNYHGKQLDDKAFELYNSIIERASKIDEEEEIKKFIDEYKEEIDKKTK